MKELQILTNALDKANKHGVFNLQEAGQILQSINSLGGILEQKESKSLVNEGLNIEKELQQKKPAKN
jgi:hypothetical protein